MSKEEKNKKQGEEDQEKFFDPEQYNTIVVSADGDKKGDPVLNLIALLTASENRELRTATYEKLKSKEGLAFLMEAIQDNNYKEHKGRLVATVWEAGIECSEHLDFFIQLALENDYLVGMEALTVIESMEGPFPDGAIQSSIEKLTAGKEKSGAPIELIEQALDYLGQYAE